MYKVCPLSNEYPHTQISEVQYEDWTEAQDEAVRLLESGVEYVQIMVDDGLLQELNLERGIVGKQFSTHVLAPYYVRLRNL
tara:strand:+ start:25 stop:267 length:243 start_codon:yes stop_codon:yes gene_type:complete